MFTYYYADVAFKNQNYGEGLRKMRGQIPTISSNAVAGRYLHAVNKRITFAPAVLLATLAIAPWLFGIITSVSISFLDGEKLIIIVSTIVASYSFIEADLQLHSYQESLIVG